MPAGSCWKGLVSPAAKHQAPILLPAPPPTGHLLRWSVFTRFQGSRTPGRALCADVRQEIRGLFHHCVREGWVSWAYGQKCSQPQARTVRTSLSRMGPGAIFVSMLLDLPFLSLLPPPMGLTEMGNGPGVEAGCSGGWEWGLCLWEASGHSVRAADSQRCGGGHDSEDFASELSAPVPCCLLNPSESMGALQCSLYVSAGLTLGRMHPTSVGIGGQAHSHVHAFTPVLVHTDA